MRRAPAFFVFLMSCGNCQIGADPIPGSGFDPAARIPRAAQVRLTSAGLDRLETYVDALVKEEAHPCGTADACPLPIATGGGNVFIMIDSLGLSSSPPSSLLARLEVRFSSTELAMTDCVAILDPQGPAPVELDVLLMPSSSGAYGLTIERVRLPQLIVAGCSEPVVRAALESAALPVVREIAARAIGAGCDVDADCPSGATCLAERCREGDAILPPSLAEEQRITVPPVLESYSTPDAVSDLAIQLGGDIAVDPDGLTAGVRGGMELVAPNPQCASVLPSPRLRPSYVAPSALPGGDTVDLDFDGVPETGYELALALSSAFVDQAVWSAYGGGLLCGAITTADFDDLHTGTLEILIPSLRFLTKSHLHPRSERPARVSAWLQREPEIIVGTGETRVDGGGNTEYVDPLVQLHLYDFEINLSALIEERWVRVLTATMDVHLGVHVMITPDNELEPIIGVGTQDIVDNIRITNNELLQDDPASIAQALPTLLSFALLEFAGSAGQFPIPALEGAELDVLGIRGVPGPSGAIDNVALYADVAITAGNLSFAAETDASLIEVRTPATADFAEGALPEVELRLSGKGGRLEYQVRVDGGFWSPFVSRSSLIVSRPELAIQGRHRIEIRARAIGDYRSLDPTPVAIDVWIDSEPPFLSVEGTTVTAWDRISEVTVEVIRSDGIHALALDANGRAELEGDVLSVRAIDQAGLASEVVLVQPSHGRSTQAASGCTGVEGRGGLGLLLGLALLIRRRRS